MTSKKKADGIESKKIGNEKQEFSVKFMKNIEENDLLSDFFSSLKNKSILNILDRMGKEDALSYLKKSRQRIAAYIKVKNPVTSFKKHYLLDGKACQDLLMFWSFDTIYRLSDDFSFSTSESEWSFSISFNGKEKKKVNEDETLEILIGIFSSAIQSLIRDGELHKACYVAGGLIATPGFPAIFNPKEQNELLDKMIKPSIEYLEGVINKIGKHIDKNRYGMKSKISELKKSYTKLGENFLKASEKLKEFNEFPHDNLVKDTERLKEKFKELRKYIQAVGEEKGLERKEKGNYKTLNDLVKLVEEIEEYEVKEFDQKIEKVLSILEKAKQIKVNGSQEGQHLVAFFEKVDKLKKTIPDDKQNIKKLLSYTHPVSMLVKHIEENNRNIEDSRRLKQSLGIFCGTDTAYFIAFNILTGEMTISGDKGLGDIEGQEHEAKTVEETSTTIATAEDQVGEKISKKENPDETGCNEKSEQKNGNEDDNMDDIAEAVADIEEREKISPEETSTCDDSSDLNLECQDDEQSSPKEYVDETNIERSPPDSGEITPVLQPSPESSRDKKYFLKYLEKGEFRKAYWIAASCDVKISSDLIGAVSLGTQIGVGSSLPAQLQSFFSNILVYNFDDISSKLLLFSAIAGSTLFTAPSSNELFTLVEFVECGVKQIDDLAQFIKSEFLYKGITIRPTDIDSALGHEGQEQKLRELKESSSELLQRNSNTYFTNYVPAKVVLRHLYREGSELTSIHRAIERNDKSKKQEIQSLLKKLSGETIVGNAHTLGLNKVSAPITGTARNQLIRRVNDTIAIGREWHNLVAGTPLGSKIEKDRILESLQQYLKKAIGCLDGIAHEELEEKIANVARRNFTSILDQLDGKGKNDIIPLNYEVLGIESLVLDDEFEIESDSEICLVDCFANYSDSDTEISLTAFGSFLKRYEFLRAKQIIDIFNLDQEYRDRLEQAIDEEHDRIHKRIKEVRNRVEDAYLLGRLDFQENKGKDLNKKISQEARRSELSGDLDKVTSQLQSSSVTISWRIREIKSIIDKIEGQLSQMEHRHNDSLMGEFKKILSQFPDSESGREDRDYVESAFKEAFKQEDNIAAFELINRAREAIQEKTSFPKTSIGENEELSSFLNNLDTYQDLFGNKRKLGVHISSMSNRKTVAGRNFGGVDKAHLKAAVAGLSAWQDLLKLNYQKSQEELISKVENIADFLDLGFRKKSVLRKSPIDDDFIYLTAELKFLVDCCPIPTFGSSMGKTVHIVLSKNKKEPDQLATFLSRHELQHKPVFLFYLQEMGIRQRKIYQQFFAKKKLSVLLIDLCLTFHLCKIRNRLPALFKIVLPFSWAQPYLMKGENVPRETFVGRDKEVESIHDINGSCIIFGGRQLGKSALLRHIYNTFNNPDKDEYIAYLDIDGLGMDPQTHEQMQEEFWRKVHKVLCREKFLTQKEISARKGAKKVADEVVDDILNTLQENPDKYLYLLLDETDYFLDNDSSLSFPIIRRLRGMMATTGRRFKIVLAGLQSVQRYKNWKNHPFAQLGTDIVVRPLKPEAAQKLILNPLHTLGFVFEKTGLILRILSQANYHPGLIQIFCHRLIEKLYIKWGNKASEQIVRTVGLDDLLTIERDPNFIEDIRNRFDWTLDLDDRYKVLIYSLVLTEDPTSSRSEREFMSLARDWWPQVFEKMDHLALRAVLDEMDGLGVLVREDEETTRMYRLRSPNLLRLLGTREQIEDELQRIISLDEPRIINSKNFHSKISEKPVSFGPMTKEQEGQIANELNIFGMTIISGSIALGLDCVSEQIKSVFAEMEEWREIIIPAQYNAVPEKLINSIKDKLKSRHRVNEYAIIDLNFLPKEFNLSEFFLSLLESLHGVCTKKSRGHIFLLIDPQHSWHWLGESRRETIIQHQCVNSIELKRWSNGAITNALENIGVLAKAKANGEDIFAITSGWHNLINNGIQNLHASSASKGKNNIIKVWKTQIDTLKDKLKTTPADILKEFGLTSEERVLAKGLKSIFNWSNFDSDGSMIISQDIFDYVSDEDEELSELLSDGGHRVKEWLQVNDIVYRTEDGQLLVNQAARDILLNGLLTQ